MMIKVLSSSIQRNKMIHFFNNLLLTSIALSCLSCFSPERDCESYHVGKFEFIYELNGEEIKSQFERTKNYEIETFNGKIDSASIKWINSCEWIVTKLNPKTNQDKKPISIKIISTSDNSYTFDYHLVGNKKNIKRGVVNKVY